MAIATRTLSPPRPSGTRNDDEGRPGPPAATVVRDPEAELRAAAVAGDRGAFAALYASYRDTVYQYLFRRCRGDRYLAEDLTHDTFTRALRSLAGYREMGRPFGAWLVTIAGNLLADYWKSGWQRFQVPWSDFSADTNERWLMVPEETGDDPAATAESRDRRRQRARALSRAMARLTDWQQQVLLLRYAEGLSVADTALKLGVDEGAVKAASYRARQVLARDHTLEDVR